jgi:IMP dehydrogenase
MTTALDFGDGWSADQVFSGANASTLSFDDLMFLPGSDPIDVSTINCATKLTKNSPDIQVPIAGGPSVTACGVEMAIALALGGSLGIIHRNQPVDAQAEMVRSVKRYHNSFILNPETLGPRHTVADMDQIKAKFGYGAIPVTENGQMGGKLIGLVTSRDIESIEDRSVLLTTVMKQTSELVTAKVPVHFRDHRSSTAGLQHVGSGDKSRSQDAEELMFTNKVGKLPVVNEDMELVALICRGDVKRSREYPLASRDATRQLLCAAAVAANDQDDWLRCQALIEAGADIICLDTDDGVTDATVDFVKRLKEMNNGNTEILAGRVSSVRQATKLLEAGVDGLRIGSFACGGAAEATAVFEISRIAAWNYGVPCCAEGVRDATQMFKALCVGASSVTMTDMLARCAEAPGDHYYNDGVRVKLYPVDEVASQTVQPPQGSGLGVIGVAPVKKSISGNTVDRGTVRSLLPCLARQVVKGLQDLSQPSISTVHAALYSGSVRIERQLSQLQPPAAAEQQLRPLRLATSGLHNRW